jgi:hypothetical protein
MAKSDLLKEAIADAKAVKETALANAKIALQEAFQPRIKSMLENELISELEDEDMMMGDELADAEADMADAEVDGEMAMDDMDVDAGEPMDVGDIEIDTDMDGEIDFTGDIMSKPGADMGAEDDMGDMEMDMDAAADDMGDELADDEMGLEEIIRELEEDLDSQEETYSYDEEVIPETYSAENGGMDKGNNGIGSIAESQSIDELIEAILAEEEEDDKKAEKEEADEKDKEQLNAGSCNEAKEALEEAYETVSHLKSVINEVNLLNAKLLYTNKLFRNFDLNEGQKMKVIENFDRAANTREAKLVFSTLAKVKER